MAPRFWVLRCCSCRLFQAKRSGKWSCSVCGQRQAVQKVYGQGSGLDCRHHVQKLNLLQGEAEEAIGRTPRCVEESVTDSKNIAAQREDSLVQQEGREEVSRWSKYLDEDSEDQEDGEEAVTERQQFCSQRKNAVEEQRKQQKSFLSSDVQEYAEENGVFQLAYRAKKVKTSERKKCLVPDGDAVSGDSVVLAVSECVVPEKNTQTPAACTKPSKWEKFLSSSDSYSENAARVTLSPQEGSGRLRLHSTTAADAGRVRTPLPQGTGFELKNCVASTDQLVWKLPSTSCSMEDVLFKEPQNHLMRAGCGVLETSARRCSLESVRRPNALVNCNTGPKPSSVSREHLFCTDEEFDDDL
ncbi:MRN complex-interacting protein isoform X2 [Balearica regulorum gibbericeps]|uniref:MRN complex-interacting protein isoform X2 n=1 Tax=Balearica regulorum gibbericeps TaxID=100784 RepID=UPI003F5DA718